MLFFLNLSQSIKVYLFTVRLNNVLSFVVHRNQFLKNGNPDCCQHILEICIREIHLNCVACRRTVFFIFGLHLAKITVMYNQHILIYSDNTFWRYHLPYACDNLKFAYLVSNGFICLYFYYYTDNHRSKRLYSVLI